MAEELQNSLFKVLSNLSEVGYSVGLGFIGFEPHYVKSTYSKAWVARYVERLFIQTDPTVQFGLSRTGHVTWKQLQELYPESKTFFDEAAHFGLRHGNTLSLRIDGQISVLSCSGSPWSEQELRMADAALRGLAVLLSKPREGGDFGLPERVKDVLALMVSGARDQEIAEILSIKIETVRARRQLAFQLTNTRTIAQLISEVIKNGLI